MQHNYPVISLYRILYVDDESSLLDIGKLFLEESGDFNVTTAISAPDGIRLLEQERYDAIVSDYQMPGMDGIEFLVEVRNHFGQVPFILFTGRGREEVVIQAINSGANFYIQKGGEPGAQFAELSHKILTAVDHHRSGEKIQSLNRLYSVLSATNKAIITIRTRDEFFSEICRILVKTGGFRMAWIGLANPDEKVIRPVASAGHIDGYLDNINISTDDVPHGRGPTGTAYRQGKYYVSNDIMGNPRMEPWRENALKRGYMANAAFPFALDTKNAGVISLYASVTGFFDEQVIDLLEELADDVSFALMTLDERDDRKQAQWALHESETRLRALVENASDIIRILDREGRIVFDTAASERLLGYPPGSTLGKSPMEFIHPDDLDMVKRELSQVYSNTNTGVPTEFRIRKADGSYTWVESSGKKLIGVPGIDGIVITTRFIDERKKGEASLRKSEERYRRIVETSHEGIWAMDEKFVTTYVNECLLGMLGYTADEMIGKQIQSFMATEELADNSSQLEQRKAGKSGSYERQFRAKDGSFRTMYVSATAIIGEGGSFQGSFAMLTDITERKRAEEELLKKNEELHASFEEITATEEELRGNLDELARQEQALRENEASLRAILDATPFPVALVDLEDNNINYWSRSATTLFGHTAPTAVQWYQLAYPDPGYRQEVIDRWKPYLERAKLSGQPVNTGEYRVTCRDGTVRTCELYATFLADKLVVTFNDVTKRKVALAALTENEERLRTTLEILPVGIFIFSRTGQILAANAMVNRIWGVTEGVVPHSSGMEEFVEYKGWWPDTGVALRPEDWAASRVLMRGETAPVDTINIQRFDGSRGTIIVSAVPIHDAGGNVNGAVAVIQDITERKRAEEAQLKNTEELHASYEELTATEEELRQNVDDLGRSEEKYRSVIESIPVGMHFYQLEPDGRLLFEGANPAADTILGISHESLKGKTIGEAFPPLTATEIPDKYRKVAREGSIWHTEQVDYDDEQVRGAFSVWAFQVAPGQMAAAFFDITGQKRAELEREYALESLKEAHSLAHIGTWDWVLETDTITWSEELCSIAGWDPAKPAPTYAELPHFYSPASWELLNDAVIRALTTGESYNLELEMIRPDGSIRWTNAFGGVQHDRNGKVTGLHGTVQDITEQKLLDDTRAFLVQCGYPGSGEDFFNTLARYLAEHLDMSYVCIDTLEGDGLTARTVAIYNDGKFDTNVTYALKDTPCGDVVGKRICCFQQEVCRLFPHDAALRDLNAESYVGTTLWSSDHKPIGLIAVIGQKPLKDPALAEAVLALVAVRAAGEMERRRVEEALRESEFKYRSLIESSSDAIFCVDHQGKYTFTNHVFASAFDKTPEFFIGKTFWDIYPKEHADYRQSVNLKVFETGLTQTAEVEVPLPGKSLFFIAKANPIKDESGNVILNLTHATDITGRKHAEEALLLANKKLNLLSSITRHDINNQMTALQGYLTLLKNKLPDPSLSDYFQKAATAAQRISSMIQFTREYEKIGVNAPVWQDSRTMVDTAAQQAPLGRVMVKNDLPSGAEVFADPLVVRVFYNLMDNAARYGGKITTIRFSVEEHDSNHIVVCEDDGDGVPALEKEKIFERGYGKNTGLGLALSREILDITGITIRETGEPGKGARFEMTVPKGAWRFAGQ